MSVGKTKYANQKNSWFFSVRVTIDGKRKQVKKEGFKTQKEAFFAEELLLKQHAENQKDPTHLPSLYDVIWQWHKNYSLRNKVTTSANVKAYIERYIIDHIKNKPINLITKQLAREWLHAFMQRDLVLSTKKRTIQIFTNVFEFAKDEYNLSSNPLANIQIQRDNSRNEFKKLDFYTLDEYKLFRSSIVDFEWLVLFDTLFYTGMRIGELQALMKSDYDPLKHEFLIRKTLTNKLLKGSYTILSSPKTNSSNRRILVPEWLHHNIMKLISMIDMPEDHFLFGFVDPLSATAIYKRNRRYANEAGLHHIKIHGFRHSHASLLINQGADVLLVAQRLGHKNISETLNTYSHLWPNKQASLIELL